MSGWPDLFDSLFQDNISPLLHFLPVQLRPICSHFALPALSNDNMEPLSLTDYRKAVKRCRKSHRFYFFDLPKSVRAAIYRAYFDNTVQVCSFAKDHAGTFANDERCQLLMTSRRTLRETCAYLYFHTKWKFVSASSFSYFTWHDTIPNRWAIVQHITLTKIHILPDFYHHMDKFRELAILILDAPFDFPVHPRRLPRRNEHKGFINTFVNRRDFQAYVHPYTYFDRAWKFCMTVHADYGGGMEEVCIYHLRSNSS
jgi:hypothetical protein